MRMANGAVHDSTNERTIGDLVRDLRDEGIRLLHQEFRLFGVELRVAARRLLRHGMLLFVGGLALGLSALGFVTAASVGLSFVLAKVMPVEVAFVLGTSSVAVLLLIAGWTAIHAGLERLKRDRITPQRTFESTREHQEWMSEAP